MDGLSDSMKQLSTTALEWKPKSLSVDNNSSNCYNKNNKNENENFVTATAAPSSSSSVGSGSNTIRANVKEFIPRGISGGTTTSATTSSSTLATATAARIGGSAPSILKKVGDGMEVQSSDTPSFVAYNANDTGQPPPPFLPAPSPVLPFFPPPHQRSDKQHVKEASYSEEEEQQSHDNNKSNFGYLPGETTIASSIGKAAAAPPHHQMPGRYQRQQHQQQHHQHHNQFARPNNSINTSRTLSSLSLSDALWHHYRNVALDKCKTVSDPRDTIIRAVPPLYEGVYCLDQNQMDHNNNNNSNTTDSRSTRNTLNTQYKQPSQQPSSVTSLRSGSFGYPTSVYKVLSKRDGNAYCLRRVDNCTKCLSSKVCAMVTDRWSSILHPGILRLHSCFINQRALFFVHEYAPNARSLYDVYMNNFNIISQQQLNPLPERLVWSLIMQLISIIRAVHSANLACRSSLLPNHIMVTRNPTGAGNTTRVRIGSVGVIDALEFDSRKPLEELQNSDMLLLGRLIVGIATRTWIVPQKTSSSFTGKSSDEAQLRSCIAFMSNHYGNPSSDLTNLVMALLQFNSNNINNSKPPTIFELCSSAIVSNHALDELNGANSALDMYDTQLCNEYESGRGLRLLMKMGFINERPEHGFDREWAEMGDCYVLKLFRDYVFHQCDDMGRPVMDMGHVITALNKLDACDSEKIALASRDGNSLLVVSFADVARCLDSAYQQLCASCVPNPVFGGSDSTVGGNSLGSMAYSSVRRGGGGTRGNYIALYGTTSEQQEHQHYVSQYHHQRMMGLGVGMGMDDSAAGACVNDGTGTNTRNYANY